MNLEPWQEALFDDVAAGRSPWQLLSGLNARAGEKRAATRYFVAACIANGLEVRIVAASEEEARRVYLEARALLEELDPSEIPRIAQE